jgi:hypothetical protein
LFYYSLFFKKKKNKTKTKTNHHFITHDLKSGKKTHWT